MARSIGGSPVWFTIILQDIEVLITNSAIRAGVRGTVAVCEGQLCSPIKSSKWALKTNMVVIHLEKITKGKWPSLFSGGAPQNAKPVVRVIYDYDATDPIELTLREGEIVSVLNQDPSGWWKGELNGKVGLFPHNFVEPIATEGAEPAEDITESANSVQEEETAPAQVRTYFQAPRHFPKAHCKQAFALSKFMQQSTLYFFPSEEKMALFIAVLTLN